MGLQFAEHPRPQSFAIPQDTGNRDLGIVVQDRLRHLAEKVERGNVARAKRLRRLRR